MSVLRNVLVNIAIAFVTVGAGGASSAGIAKDVPEPHSVSGFYWERVIDARHPAAPPRLIPRHGTAAPSGSRKGSRRPVICVRAGEHLLLHETGSGSSTVSLAATALESGGCGDRVRARIEVTRALTEVTVLGQGVGVLDRRGEKWR
jgi:hypothetical protein